MIWKFLSGTARFFGAASVLLAASATDAQDQVTRTPDVVASADSDDTSSSSSGSASESAMRSKDESNSGEKSDRARFQEFDKLRAQGQVSDWPGAYETLTRDVGGFRTWLHERDLYFRGISSNNLTYDVGAGNSPKSPQRYTGQSFTFSQTNELRLSWKLGGSGDDITQINVGGLFNYATWRSLAPPGAKFSALNIYSSFFDRTIELKAGVGSYLSDFIGIFAGGNPILASGLAGSIPISAGLSGGAAVSPGVTLQLNANNGLYAKSGVLRSLIPEGMVEDAAGAGHGLKITRDGAKALYIQEFGFRRSASNEGHQLWLRAGGSHNETRYRRLDGQGEERNWTAYALADYQVYQPSEKQPFRGIYAGASALFAADPVNAYTRTLEARAYAVGMIPGRARDQVTLTLGTNQFTRAGVEALRATGQIANQHQYTAGALYAIHVTSGLFISPSITYIRNPSLIGDLKPAVNLGTSILLLF